MLICVCPCVDILNTILLVREFKVKSFTNEMESTLLYISLDHLFCHHLSWRRSSSHWQESCWAIRIGHLSPARQKQQIGPWPQKGCDWKATLLLSVPHHSKLGQLKPLLQGHNQTTNHRPQKFRGNLIWTALFRHKTLFFIIWIFFII